MTTKNAGGGAERHPPDHIEQGRRHGDDDRSEENIIPGAFDPRVAEAVAAAVAKAARETGVARL